eukprot:2605351-Amphidinium_carterae.1
MPRPYRRTAQILSAFRHKSGFLQGVGKHVSLSNRDPHPNTSETTTEGTNCSNKSTGPQTTDKA